MKQINKKLKAVEKELQQRRQNDYSAYYGRFYDELTPDEREDYLKRRFNTPLSVADHERVQLTLFDTLHYWITPPDTPITPVELKKIVLILDK